MPRLMRARHPVCLTVTVLTAIAWPLAGAAGAQSADSAATRAVTPGVSYQRIVRATGPWVVNVLRIDLRRPELELRHVRAHDQLRTRERTTDMARRVGDAGATVLAAVNADFFDLKTGENENNQVIAGEWWKGVKVTESPFDTYSNVHAQFALDSLRHPLIERFQFSGEVRSRQGSIPLIALNARVKAAPEGAALFTSRFGPSTPPDTGRAVVEAPLQSAGHRADTVLYVRRGGVRPAAGGGIPPGGAVLAGYGPRAQAVASLGAGETLRVVMRGAPRPAHASPLALVVGGWPRIIRDGINVAATAASDEGTISRNAEVRHPRTAIGFSRDSATLYLVTVDGRSDKSVGMTLVELAELMRELGVWQALNFDGGGSTTMVVGDAIVNSPSDATGEREVGNALVLVRRAAPPDRGSAPSAAPPRAGAPPALDSARLMSDLSALAADSMEGRRVGTPGGARARAFLLRRLDAIGLAPVADGIALPFTTTGRAGGAAVQGVNLAVQVRGTTHPERFVVVSAHYDHLGVQNGVTFNGADDNASGTAGVLALAQWFKDHPPANSMMFVFFDAEESGDVGSAAFLANPPVLIERLVANVNLDMVSRNTNGELYAAGATPWPVMKPLIDSTARAARVKLLLGHDTGPGQANWTHQSDHGAFHDHGIPWVYFGVEDHADYHRPTDTAARIQPGFFYRAVQTVADFAGRLDAALDRVQAARKQGAGSGR